MRDLESSIADSRRAFARDASLSEAEMDELESHLRDAIAPLRSAGLSEDEAFLIAMRRLGDPGALRVEYATAGSIGPWRDRAAWGVVAILAFQCLTQIGGFLTSGGTLGTALLGLRGEHLKWTSLAFTLIGPAIVFGLVYWRRRLRLDVRPATLVCAAVACLVLGTTVVRIGVNLVVVRLLPPEAFGQIALGMSFGQLAWSVVMPLALCVAWFRLRRAGDAAAA